MISRHCWFQIAVALTPVAFSLGSPRVVGGQPFVDSGVAKGADVSLVCDVAVDARIDPAVDNDFFTFNARDGEVVTITVVNDPNSAFLTPYWRLLIDGMPASSCGFSTIASQDDCGPFSEAAGSSVSVVIEVEEFFNDTIGDYAVHLQRLPFATACDGTPLTDDVGVKATIDQFVDNDLFTFCVTEGAIAQVTVVNDPNSVFLTPYWRVIDGVGGPAPDCGFFTIAATADCGPLSAADNPHRVQVQEFFNDLTGDYSVHVNALSGGLISCPTLVVFADGFESGDTIAWSSTVP